MRKTRQVVTKAQQMLADMTEQEKSDMWDTYYRTRRMIIDEVAKNTRKRRSQRQTFVSYLSDMAAMCIDKGIRLLQKRH